MIIYRKKIYIYIRKNELRSRFLTPREKKIEMESANVMPVPVHNFASVLADVSTPTWTT